MNSRTKSDSSRRRTIVPDPHDDTLEECSPPESETESSSEEVSETVETVETESLLNFKPEKCPDVETETKQNVETEGTLDPFPDISSLLGTVLRQTDALTSTELQTIPHSSEPSLAAMLRDLMTEGAISEEDQGHPQNEAFQRAPYNRKYEITKRVWVDALKRKLQSGWKPLHVAAQQDRQTLARAFLKHGADPEVGDNGGWRPLHFAAQYDHVDMCKILIESGANPLSTTEEGLMPLMLAVGLGNVEVAKYLLGTHIGHVKEILRDGTSLFFLATLDDDPKLEFDQLSVMNLLKDAGANVDAPDHMGITPLLYACAKDRTTIATWLLENGADLHHRDSEGRTALAFAAFSLSAELVESLIHLGADVTATDNRGWTALHLCCQRKSGDVASTLQALLDGGGSIVLDMSTHEGVTALHLASHAGRAEIAEQLFRAGADIGAATKDGETPVFAAVRSGSLATVKMLLDERARVDTRRRDNGFGLAHLAVKAGDVEILKHVLYAGADPNLEATGQETTSLTPLHLAVYQPNDDIALALLEMGATP